MASSYHSRIVERDGRRCRACGNGRLLEVHHIVYRSRGGTDEDSNLVTLCKNCHVKAHQSSLRVWELKAVVWTGLSLTAVRLMKPRICVTCDYRGDTGYCIMESNIVAEAYTCGDWRQREEIPSRQLPGV